MNVRRISSLIMAVAAGASAVLMGASAASAEVPMQDFQVGIQLFDNRLVSGDEEPLFTDRVGLTPVVTSSGWARDSNGVDPDGARIALRLVPGPDADAKFPTDLDFRIEAQARDLPEIEDGEIGRTPWASQNGGETGVVTDMNGFDPDQYRVLVRVQPMPMGARPIADFRLFIQAVDRGEVDGPKSYTPWASEGGGMSPIAFDQNQFRPDGFRIGLEVVFEQPPSQ